MAATALPGRVLAPAIAATATDISNSADVSPFAFSRICNAFA
jgi:hypothetical protein